MKKIYGIYCRIEELIVGTSFAAIVALTFMNAVLRVFKRPIIYADDMCLLLFSWTAFLGADVSLRYCRLVGMDLVARRFPPKVQKILALIVHVVIIDILVILVIGGIKIIQTNGMRPFNTLEKLGIRYGVVTAALPVCGVMIILTCVIKIAKLIIHFSDDDYTLKKSVPKDTGEIGEENTGASETPVVIGDAKEVQ